MLAGLSRAENIALQRAQRLQNLLDKTNPFWFWTPQFILCLEALNEYHPNRCILAMIYGDYLTGLEELGINEDIDEDISLGVELEFVPGYTSDIDGVTFDMLTMCHKSLVKGRMKNYESVFSCKNPELN